jgi:hypothetical protein
LEDLIGEFWWLIFPIFGIGLAAFELVKDEARADDRRLEGK